MGYIGRLDPRDGRITRYPMPDSTVRDPRTLAFDSRGDIWFTAQGGNIVGKLTVKRGSRRRSSTFRLVAAAAAGT